MESVGGQAVIEGVLMKCKDKVAISIRKKDGTIKTKKETYSLGYRYSKIPFLRGIIILAETLYIGTKALIYSTEQQEEKEEKIGKFELIFSISFSIIFAVLFFILLPLFISKLITKTNFLFNLIDGALRILIFVIYILAISLMKDVRRVFQYHGAEHKVVNCYEDKKELTIKNCKKYSTVHLRCGTSFIFIVLVLSIIVFSLIYHESFLIKFISRIILIPIIASLSYELLRLSAKYNKNIILNAITYPGLLIQKITTREPDEKQLEVAIKSLKEVL